MCGIAGLINRQSENLTAHHESLVATMCDRQAYRGPDDRGVVRLGRVCLGSLRLSILDLSPAGHMPMCDKSERWWIAYNGEIYNFQALRQELEGLGHEFRSHTDTEVALHAFIEWGEDCLHRFVGMFAFAIYDTQEERLSLVRDRYGIKPLYYAREAEYILFGSEVKAVLSVRGQPSVNRQSLIEWLLYRNVDVLTPDTLFESVSSVLPGEIVTITGDTIHRRQYYTPIMFVSEDDYRRYERGSVTEVVNAIDTGLNEATSQRLIADVPVGTLCSGGLDSSLITAIAARHSRQITAFNVAIEGYPSIDENRFAKQVTDCLGLELVTFPLTGEVFRRELPHIIHLSDFPLSHPNSVAYYLISQVARRHGVIVLLSGEGADELFGGYTWRYRRLRNLLRLQLLLDRLPEKIREGIGLVGLASIGIYATGIAYRKLLPSTVAFIDRFARQEWQAQCAEAYRFLGDRVASQVLGTMLSDLADFLTPLLRRLDRTSMGASVEARVPFLDHRVVHNAINLPLSYRVGSKGEKWILKQVAARYLPSAIANRKKAGFPLPLQDYLAPVASPAFFEGGFCTEVLQLGRNGLAKTVESWQKNVFGFFSLLALEIWGRQFFMGESAPEISERLARVEKGKSK